MMPDMDFDWAGLYERIGVLVEQNKTLFRKTDDHEMRLRSMDNRLDQLGEKMDTRFAQTDRKIDSLSSKIDELKKPSPWHRFTQWIGDHTHPMIASLCAALGTGVGGYLIGLIIHH